MKGRSVCGPVLIPRILDFLVPQCVDTAPSFDVSCYTAAGWQFICSLHLCHHMDVLIVVHNFANEILVRDQMPIMA